MDEAHSLLECSYRRLTRKGLYIHRSYLVTVKYRYYLCCSRENRRGMDVADGRVRDYRVKVLKIAVLESWKNELEGDVTLARSP